MNIKMRFFIFLLFVFGAVTLSAQDVPIGGKVIDRKTGKGLSGVVVSAENYLHKTVTNIHGEYRMDIPAGTYELTFEKAGYSTKTVMIDVVVAEFSDGYQNFGDVIMVALEDEELPVITLDDIDVENDEGEEDNYFVSGMLGASRDPFANAVAYNFSALWFDVRGLGSEYSPLYINGVPVNELENGNVYYSAWGGLNDAMRNRDSHAGMGAIAYSFGGVNGATSIDIRASKQWKQTRISYAASNRSYNNRLMFIHSTGVLPNKWAFSVSGSRRWANEAYVPGTFYDAWAYYFSADKLINDKHTLSFTVMGAPNKKGKSSYTVQEMYDLKGTNYYNPNWGYQNGKKRNARVSNRHQPYFILRHDWEVSDKTNLTTSIGYQTGTNGSTSLDWFEARDPRPDYYKNVPSYIEDPATRAKVEELYRQDENLGQLDWQRFYDVNRSSTYTIDNANGTGESISGMSQYILSDKHYDSDELNFNTVLNTGNGDNFSFDMGLSAQQYKGYNYNLVHDLLGGKFYVDIDKFLLRDYPQGGDFVQNDLDRPNRILHEGDRFGYDYNMTIQKGDFWAQAAYSLRKFDIFIGGDVSKTIFWRTGNVKNGRFPDSSKGDSEKADFLNYGAKAGITFKINNRNYLFTNGLYQTRAPYVRNSFISPRTRNQIMKDLKSETLYFGEAGYRLFTPGLKAQITGYYGETKDQTKLRNVYHELQGYGNMVLRGIDKTFLGTEVAVEYAATDALTLTGVAAIGQYYYSSRQHMTFYQDKDAEVLLEDELVYSKNFRVEQTPQNAYSFKLDYRGKQFWRASLSFNYFDNYWIDFNPLRRTSLAMRASDDTPEVGYQSDLWYDIINQEKAEPGYTIDLFLSKSIKLTHNKFVYLNMGISNLLDNTNLINGGYEQLRFDFRGKNVDKFAPKYKHARGRTYFVSMTYRIK